MLIKHSENYTLLITSLSRQSLWFANQMALLIIPNRRRKERTRVRIGKKKNRSEQHQQQQQQQHRIND